MSLRAFDADLRRALVEILTQYAFRLNGMLPADGSEPAAKVHIEAPTFSDVTPTSYATDPFHVGNQTSANIAIDENEIMARSNGAVSSLNLNADGGVVTVGLNAVTANTGLKLSSGQIQFPATQQASSDANTLDDYEEGTWTPVYTFVTPGDMAVTYTTQLGTYIKVGKLVRAQCVVTVSAFTHTTAAGEFRITGLPFASVSGSGRDTTGSVEIQGFTWPGARTQMNASIVPGGSHIRVVGTGSGLSRAALTAADHASGTNVVVVVTIEYEAAN